MYDPFTPGQPADCGGEICPECQGRHITEVDNDYLLRVCDCTRCLPLSDRAVLARRVEVANQEARDKRDAERDWHANIGKLRSRCWDVLGYAPNPLRRDCGWMHRKGQDGVFGPADVDGLKFALVFWDECPDGQLALLVDDEPVTFDTLAELGALLIERNNASLDPDACHADGDAAFPIDEREVCGA
jgi:hypothetical protein